MTMQSFRESLLGICILSFFSFSLFSAPLEEDSRSLRSTLSTPSPAESFFDYGPSGKKRGGKSRTSRALVMEKAELEELTSLDLSHNHFQHVSGAFEAWLCTCGRRLDSLDLGQNPWTQEALSKIKRILRNSTVHTLSLQQAGLTGDWNILQGFFDPSGYPALSYLDVRGNNLHLRISSILHSIVRKPFFVLESDQMTVTVNHKKFMKKKKELEPSSSFVHLIKAGKDLDTLRLGVDISTDEARALFKKLKPYRLKHLEILGEVGDIMETLPVLLSLKQLCTVTLGMTSLNNTNVIKQVASSLMAHPNIHKVFLNGGEDISVGSAEAFLWTISRDYTPDLPKRRQALLDRTQRKLQELMKESSSFPMRAQKQKSLEQRVMKLRGNQPLTVVFPESLEVYKDRLDAQKPGDVKLAFGSETVF